MPSLAIFKKLYQNPPIAFRSRDRIARAATHEIIHHIRISTDGEINAAVKSEWLFLHKTGV
jgi:hypothetical protein